MVVGRFGNSDAVILMALIVLPSIRLILAALEDSGSQARRLQWISALQQIKVWLSALSEDKADGGPEPKRLTNHPLSAAVMSIRLSGVKAYMAVVRNVISSKQVVSDHGQIVWYGTGLTCKT
jgi:hypothetical protein